MVAQTQNLTKMLEKEFNALVEHKIIQILAAANDYQNNPEKAKEYITRTVRNIAKAGKGLGELSVVNELFG